MSRHLDNRGHSLLIFIVCAISSLMMIGAVLYRTTLPSAPAPADVKVIGHHGNCDILRRGGVQTIVICPQGVAIQ